MAKRSDGPERRARDGNAPACFVVSAFGTTPEERTRTKQVLRHLVRKVLEPRGYEVIRADEIDDEGLITNQVIEHLLEDALVVADLTGRNPNVFYEVAVRHAARKPIIHLITAGEQIPFDVANMRAVQYALDDPDLLEQAQEELDRKAAAIEENGGSTALNPITVARDVSLLRESDKPELRHAGDVLAALHDLRDEVTALGRRINDGRSTNADAMGAPSKAPRAEKARLIARTLAASEIPSGGLGILVALQEAGPLTNREISEYAAFAPSTVSRYLRQLENARMVERVGSRWSWTSAFKRYIDDHSAD